MRASINVLISSVTLMTVTSTQIQARILLEKDDQATSRRIINYKVESLEQGYRVTEDYMTGSRRIVTVVPGLLSKDQTIHRDCSESTYLIGAMYLPVKPLSKEAREQQDEHLSKDFHPKGLKKWLGHARDFKRTGRMPSKNKKLLLIPSYDGLDSQESDMSVDWGL